MFFFFCHSGSDIVNLLLLFCYFNKLPSVVLLRIHYVKTITVVHLSSKVFHLIENVDDFNVNTVLLFYIYIDLAWPHIARDLFLNLFLSSIIGETQKILRVQVQSPEETYMVQDVLFLFSASEVINFRIDSFVTFGEQTEGV